MGNTCDPTVHTRSVLKPHGVWAVISPFNFRMALSGRPSGGAWSGTQSCTSHQRRAAVRGKAREIADLAGLPRASSNMVSGPGGTVVPNCRKEEASMACSSPAPMRSASTKIFKTFSKRFPMPWSVEMGGKNPAIVSARADLEEGGEA